MIHITNFFLESHTTNPITKYIKTTTVINIGQLQSPKCFIFGKCPNETIRVPKVYIGKRKYMEGWYIVLRYLKFMKRVF